jgi:hypothetical protein
MIIASAVSSVLTELSVVAVWMYFMVCSVCKRRSASVHSMIVQSDTEMHSVASTCSTHALKLTITAASKQLYYMLLPIRRYTDI